jgi:flagellar basal-body rod modification protein FlgD
MTTVSNAVQSTPAANLAAATTPAATPGTDIQDRFLKLLVTQMKNQDPLNPMDNAQVTSQLAQISTVNGIQQLNTTIQGMSTAFLSSQSLQSASLIGHTVLTDGSSLNVADGAPAYGAVQLTQAADSVNVNIVSPAGNLVRQLQLGAQNTGTAGFQWDGLDDSGAKVAAGSYTFKVTATSGGQSVNTTSFMAGTVSSVTLGSDGLHLTVGGIGDIQMQQIKRIM